MGLAFGAALPDLTSMARLRLDQSVLPPALREGVRLHHRTDGVFHALEAFSAGARALSAELSGRGLGTGPARAIGHAGFELLLDGCLLDEPGVEAAFEGVLVAGGEAVAAVPPGDAARWLQLLEAMRRDRWWLGYGYTALVAAALHRRLRHRRLLAFGEGDIEVVTEVLAARRPAIAALAGSLIGQVVAQLVSVQETEDDVGGEGTG